VNLLGYIKREDALRASEERKYGREIPVVFKRDIEKIPDEDVAKVTHGEWVNGDGEVVKWDDEHNCPSESCYCSECHEWLVGSDEYDIPAYFCPNCGARMDGE